MRHLIPIVLSVTMTACQQSPANKQDYPAQVGDIEFDAKTDDPGFVVCDQKKIFQYYNFGKGIQYKGEKIKINEHFKEEFHAREQTGQSGLLTIRFVVNCKGAVGRFRIQGMDLEYNQKQFDNSLTNRYLLLTQKMNGWIPGEDGPNKFDYYQYLTFKLENGKLMEILP